jgi:hypothetical protein
MLLNLSTNACFIQSMKNSEKNIVQKTGINSYNCSNKKEKHELEIHKSSNQIIKLLLFLVCWLKVRLAGLTSQK